MGIFMFFFGTYCEHLWTFMGYLGLGQPLMDTSRIFWIWILLWLLKNTTWNMWVTGSTSRQSGMVNSDHITSYHSIPVNFSWLLLVVYSGNMWEYHLVGGFKHFFFSIIYGIIPPIDELIFFKMIKTTTNQSYNVDVFNATRIPRIGI